MTDPYKKLVAPLIRRLTKIEEEMKRFATRQGNFSRRGQAVNIVGDAFTVDHHDHFLLNPQTGVLDDLATINGGSDGRRIVIYPRDSGDTINVVATGNIATARVLDSQTDALELIYSDNLSKWLEPSAASIASTEVPVHAAGHYVTAHPSPPADNPISEYYSVNYDVVGGTGVDESTNIIQMLETIGLAGGGIVHISAVTPGNVVELESLVSLYYSNLDVRFNVPLSLGAAGGLRMMGQMDEFVRAPATNAGKLASTFAEGDTVATLAVSATSMQADDFVVGDQVVFRGENDITGKALYKQIFNVVAINTGANTITLAQESEETFEPTYPGSAWPPDLTTGTTIYVVRKCGLEADAFRGDMTASVESIVNAEVGALYRVSDGRNEVQLNPAALRGLAGNPPYENDCNMEFIRIVALVDDLDGTGTITFDRPLSNDYLAASPYFGAFAKVLPVTKSKLSGTTISYHDDQTSKNAHTLAMGFCMDCEISGFTINGQITTTTGRAGQACRIADSYNSWGRNLIVRDAGHTASGEGYGVTHYKSTGGGYESCEAYGCRHGFLVQASVCFTIRNCQTWDDHISGFDLHGANERDGLLHSCTANRSVGHTSDATQGALYRYGNTSHAVGCHYISTIDCRAFGAYETDIAGFDFLPASKNLSFISCYVEGCYYGFKSTKNSKQCQPVQTAANIIFQSCHVLNIVDRAIYIQGAPTYDGTNSVGKFDNILFDGIILHNTLEHFHVDGNNGVTNMRFVGCEILKPITSPGNDFYGYNIDDTDGLVIRNCSAHLCSRGLRLSNVLNAYVLNNQFTATIDSIPFNNVGGNTGLVFMDNAVPQDWTIGITFGGAAVGITYSLQLGSYERFGKTIRATGVVILSNKGSSTGDALITGLPFATRTTTNFFQPVFVRASGLTGTVGGIQAYTFYNATTIGLEYTNTGGPIGLNNTHFTNTTGFLITALYEID